MGKHVKSETIPAAQAAVVQAQAALVAEGGALMRLENETQMMVARLRPRDENAVLDKLFSELREFPALAEELIYSKPVGMADNCPTCGANRDRQKQCPKCGATIPQVFARGLSIRAAENCACRWGNNAKSWTLVGQDDQGSTIAAVFLDYETNTRTLLTQRVSRFYLSRSGSMVRHADDRFADVVLPAHASRLLREAILRSLPHALKEAYRQNAERIISDGVSGLLQHARIATALAGIGVSAKQIEILIGKPLTDAQPDDLVSLRGIYQSIRDGEQTIQEVFSKDTPSEPGAVAGEPKGDLFGKPEEKPSPEGKKPLDKEKATE